MQGLYVLDRMGYPVSVSDPLEQARWLLEHGRQIAQVYVGAMRISTVFLGIDADVSRAPILFETVVEASDGERRVARSRCRHSALAVHRMITRSLQQIIIEYQVPTLDALVKRYQNIGLNAVEKEIVSAYVESGTPLKEAEIRASCAAGRYSDVRERGEAGWIAVRPLLFTHAIVSGIGNTGNAGRWHYETYGEALAALTAWDGSGEPSGWMAHPDTVRVSAVEDFADA